MARRLAGLALAVLGRGAPLGDYGDQAFEACDAAKVAAGRCRPWDATTAGWRPELPNTDATMWEAVERELDRSLARSVPRARVAPRSTRRRRYPANDRCDAAAAARVLAEMIACREHVVLVYRGRVFVRAGHDRLGKHKPQSLLPRVFLFLFFFFGTAREDA